MLNREQWLEDRKKGIGGSEVAAILGLNQYKTAFQVWQDKTGRAPNEQENAFMKFGSRAEKLVVEYWEEETGLKTAECAHFSHPQYDFIMGTPDRVYSKDGKTGVLECKTSKLIITPDDPRFINFFCQLQWYMGLVQASIGEVAILDRVNCEFARFEFEFNDDFYQEVLGKIVNFWENHVAKDVPPEPANYHDVEIMFKKHVNGAFVEAAPETLQVVERLKSVKEQIKELKDQEEELAGQIKMVLRDSEFLSYDGRPLVTWKAASDSTRFDADLFKKTHPDLYKQFQKTVPGSRRFLVK